MTGLVCQNGTLMTVLTCDGLGYSTAAPRERVIGVVVARAVSAAGEPVLYLARVVELLATHGVVNGVRRHHDLRCRRTCTGRYQLRRAFDPRRRFLEKFNTGRDRN